MGFSRIRYKLYKRAVNAHIVMNNGMLIMKTFKYDINNFLVYKDKAYMFEPDYAYFVNGHAHAFYTEDDPYPKKLSDIEGLALEDRAANLYVFKESKVIQEIVKGAAMGTLLIILVGLNLLISGIIIAKLWGAFEGK